MSTDITIPREIMRQLGSGAFIAMTGARHPLALDARTLRVRFPRGLAKDGICILDIRLNAMDTYDLTALTHAGREVATATDIYNDQLKDAVTRLTGLATSMPRIFRSAT